MFRVGHRFPTARRLGRVLVVGQVAVAALLAVGAGLLARSFVRLTHEPLGFEPSRVLAAYVELPAHRYAQPAPRRGCWIWPSRSAPPFARSIRPFPWCRRTP